MFRAIVIDKQNDTYSAKLSDLDESALDGGDVEVEVLYSTLNYKDALAITGKAPVVRSFPMVPGIDFVGTVRQSHTPSFQTGQKVILNGWGVGETHWGGLAQKARVKGDWLVPLPSTFSAKDAMAIGTAGYTAMLCVLALEDHGLTPEAGKILVTGATGGVGSVAVAILAKLGYRVAALTGRPSEADYLHSLGAQEIIERSELDGLGKPLRKEKWAGVIDAVGSHVLANACAETQYGGVVAACGLAKGMDFPATVAPFILRGITLVGIDSVMCPRERRMQAWQRLEQDLELEKIKKIYHEISLDQVEQTAQDLLNAKVRGRVIVDVNT